MAAPVSAAPRGPVFLREFDGPLDLLLDEVRRQKVAIEEIAMAPMVARYLEYVRQVRAANLDLNIEWLHTAATLIHWKSKSLLPVDAAETSGRDRVRDDVIEQLRAHGKQVADELTLRGSIEQTKFSRAAGEEFRPAEDASDEAEEPPFVSVWDLIQQARELAQWGQQQRDDRRQWGEAFGVQEDPVTVAEMVDYLRAQLSASDGEIDAVRLLESQATVTRRSCLFLGLLDMAREQEVELRQEGVFGPILLRTEAVRRSARVVAAVAQQIEDY